MVGVFCINLLFVIVYMLFKKEEFRMIIYKRKLLSNILELDKEIYLFKEKKLWCLCQKIDDNMQRMVLKK